jgi:hypothetical protein
VNGATANILLESKGVVWCAIIATPVSFIHRMHVKWRQSVCGYMLHTEGRRGASFDFQKGVKTVNCVIASLGSNKRWLLLLLDPK